MSDPTATKCRWNGRENPRVIPGEHFDDCTGNCDGCWPCPELHCLSCGMRHADVTCAPCLAEARADLTEIARLCGFPLLEEALLQGVDSEAAMLLGPAANAEAWNFRKMSAVMGRVDAGFLDDCRDEAHPLWTLGWIEAEWREAWGHEMPARQTIHTAADYVSRMLHIVADTNTTPDGTQCPEFADAKTKLSECRAYLENVLSEGERDEKGAPCVQCERPMVRVVTDQGAQDSYHCRRCRRTVAGDQYRYAVGAAYRAHADRLTATDINRQYDIPAGSVRGWASEKVGKVRKRGKDANGLQLYDVNDVLAAAGRHADGESA